MAATERRVRELLDQLLCQDAITELYRVYSRTKAPRLHLWFARAFYQCGVQQKARESYDAVLAHVPFFSDDELLEAHRQVVVANLSTPQPVNPTNPTKTFIASENQKNARGSMAAGGSLLALGAIMVIAGGVVAFTVCDTAKDPWCIGPRAGGGAAVGVGLVLFMLPGALMLESGARRY